MRVLVAEAKAPGAGASGGVVGALSPHLPDRWNARKEFQLRALLAAPAYWAGIAAAGGVDPGYARLGRLMPLRTEAARALAEARAGDAIDRWGAAAAWRVEGPDQSQGWLAPEAAAFGAVRETLSARIAPRRAVAALAAALGARGVETRCGWRALGVEDRAVRFDRGRIAARAVILAAGPGLAALAPDLPGRGVKGQAAVLVAASPAGAPLIFDAGVYVAPQPDGRIAVGSTSEDGWSVADATDEALDAVLARARALCPALRKAPVVERWAGLRPRAARPDPMLGPLPGREGVFVAGGAFKTGFGLAPAVGEAVAAMVVGEAPDLPPGYSVADHLAGGGAPRARAGGDPGGFDRSSAATSGYSD
jgi:glycine oxidase